MEVASGASGQGIYDTAADDHGLNIILEADAIVLVSIEKLAIAFSMPSGLLVNRDLARLRRR